MILILLAIGAFCSTALIGPDDGSDKPTGLEGKLDKTEPKPESKHFNLREFTRHPFRETGELYNDAMIEVALANRYVPYDYVNAGPYIMAAVGVKRYLESKGLHLHLNLHVLPPMVQAFGVHVAQAPHLVYQGIHAIMAAFGMH